MGFLMILGGIEVNYFSCINLVLEVKLGDDPWFYNLNLGNQFHRS